MNVFFLSTSPKLAARFHNDCHVVKMLTESVQILSTALWHHKKNLWYYKPTHPGHPAVKWAAMSSANYHWLLELGIYLNEEFELRFQSSHAAFDGIKYLRRRFSHIPDGDFTRPPLCMPDECKSSSPVKSYREYYRTHKVYDRAGKLMAVWSERGQPYWWDQQAA